ncbi:hypothetical protein JW848_00940 [Candidatus Bipolaricaulota bacterium]|nr:hypothetical protein [Candidatus Bipolaricaulota bacterium]
MRNYPRLAPTGILLILLVCVGTALGEMHDSRCDWLDYCNESYGFRICYPSDFIVSETDESIVVDGPAVIFVPGFDPSISEAGAGTNLHDLKVAIGVTEVRAAASPGTAAQASGFVEVTVANGIEFAVYRHAEGAVGNRYETLSYVTAMKGRRFEIVLFLHYGHPDCYGAGQITPFDSAAIVRWFEEMVHSFSV